MAANHTAYVYDILPNASGPDENHAVHQTDPAWVLTFLQWSVRDTLRTEPTPGSNYTTIPSRPLVVENDCIELSVADSKSVLTPSMTATLLITDVNYETELSPGDFVFVNMLNWEQDARRVANQARSLKPINGPNDGFKGFFKVQSVFKVLNTDPESGTKSYAVRITGFAFTEFNNSIYFNPYLLSSTDQQNLQLYVSNIGLNWASIQTDKGLTQIQLLIQYLINSFIGSGFPDNGRKTDTIAPVATNTHFFMPKGVGNLLGLSTMESAKDAYTYIFGIQQYAAGQNQSIAQGMNPTGIPQNATQNSRFIILPNPVEGNTFLKPEYWNQQKAWSILNQFTNSPLNEMYTCFRISPNGSVLPTVIFRQIPFTTDNFQADSYKVTRFMSLPRWNISPALAFGFNLGKDEVMRTNFVQYYGQSVTGPSGVDISVETAKQNYIYDLDDVKRNGLRPHVVTSEFDRISDNSNAQLSFRSPGWAKILGDALIGGHLKFSGTISFVGIPQPIAVGDNLQFDNIVFHIEQISHSCHIQRNGDKVIKTFRTTVAVTYGMSLANGQNVVYAEMKYGSAYDARNADYKSTQILPGISESQSTYYRPVTPDGPVSPGASFVEPNTNTSVDKSTRDS